MPIVSVVIPVYNGEKTIRETIDCVLNQSLSDFELLVINDGSKDSTLEIVSKIQDPRLNVFSYPNAGLAATRNRGISLASSDYISFIDADDLWTPDKLEAQLKALQENPQAAVAYSWTDCIDESSQFLRKGGYLTVNGDVYSQLLVVDFLESGSNPLFRKQALIEVSGFDESLTAAEDWDILLRLAARYPFVAVPSPQILYRVSPTSMSANVERQEATCLKVLERAYTQAPASLQYLKKYSMANLYKYLTYKVLEGTPERNKGLIAARFFWEFVSRDRALLRKRFIWKILLKISLWIFLSPQQAQRVIQAKFKTLPHIHTTLLTQFQIEPF
jgi:glycosyltransferase involved in cell wall biosynthesis